MSRKQKRGTNDGKTGLARLEAMISYVLIIGVIASLLLEAVGLFLYYRTFGTVAISYDGRLVLYAHDFFDFLVSLFRGPLGGSESAVKLMALGMAILILTPYVRAVLSVVYFASRKNLTYLIVTLFVLIVLTLSMLQ